MKLDPLYFFLPMIEALDREEHDLVGATVGHGKRVAYLSYLMTRSFPWSPDERLAFVLAALLHDCGSVETIREMRDAARNRKPFSGTFSNGRVVDDASIHAQKGKDLLQDMPFYSQIKGVVMMHHEWANGTGPMGLREDAIDKRAQVLYLADRMDIRYDLLSLSESGFREMVRDLLGLEHIEFSHDALVLLEKNLTYEAVQKLQEIPLNRLLKSVVPSHACEYSLKDMLTITRFFERIVDNKSSFTKDHSHGIAMKALAMAQKYGWNEEKQERFLLAASLHDYGKLRVPSAILEKAGPLTAEEFQIMKNHVRWTYEVLDEIPDFGDIRDWASFHHEKLDGSGYVKGLCSKDLSFEERLMACIDIYQALTEKRPYKEGFSHEKAIAIMAELARKGKIDGSIVKDLDAFFASNKLPA